MAYQLQPGLAIVQNAGALPAVKATEEIFVYPQPSSINCGGCRPNTMLWGTAPYMAGKGSPAQYIDVSDQLRPQTTSRFNKVSFQHMSVTYSHSPTWSARSPSHIEL